MRTMNTNTNYIEFRKKRTFSETMNAIIEFTKREFLGMLKAQVYISGPVMLVAAILFALLFDTFFTLGFTGSPDFFTVEAGLYFVGLMFFSLLATVFVTAVSLDYLYIYVNDRPDKITPDMVWKRSKKTVWGILFHAFILSVLLIIAYFVVVGGFTALVALVSPVFFILFFIPFGVIFYFVGVFSIYFPIYVFEQRGLDIGTIIGRCFKLVKNHWWKTFGVFMITSIVVGVVSSIFFIPPYVTMLVQVFDAQQTGAEEAVLQEITRSWWVVGFFILYVVARYLLSFLIFIGTGIQYHNLVEQKEAAGLMNTIASIDTENTESKLGADRSGDSEHDEDY